MRVALTGTPGTGKTTVADRLGDVDVPGPATGMAVVHLNETIEREGLWSERDEERDSLVVDLDAVESWLGDRDDVLVESHLAHLLDADLVVVLRCHPDDLRDRLATRDESAASVEENAEAEALDVVLAEAVERHGRDRVVEIDTTGRTVDAVAADVAAAIAGDIEPRAGIVDFMTD